MTVRLGVVDEMFLRGHRGRGTPIALQGVWRTSGTVPRSAVESLRQGLSTGSLAYRVVMPRFPGARPRWERNPVTYPVHYSARAIPTGGVAAWADAQGVDLNPERGPGWRLTAAAIADGGTAISIVCSHTVTDGKGLIRAVDHVLGATMSELTDPKPSSDIADAFGQVGTVLAGLVRGLPAVSRPASVTSEGPYLRTNERWGPPVSAMFAIDSRAFDAAAQSAGATPNSLFVALVTTTLRASGFDGDMSVSVPIDQRSDDGLGNQLAMSGLRVTPSDSVREIHAKCTAGYRKPDGAPPGIPMEVLGLLPERTAHRLTAGAGERDVLCSNLGVLPESFSHIGGASTTGVAARAIHPGMGPAQLGTLRTRLSGYLARLGDHYTLSLVSLDPERVRDQRMLEHCAEQALAAHGLHATAW